MPTVAGCLASALGCGRMRERRDDCTVGSCVPGLENSASARRHARRDELLAKRLSVGDDISIGEILRTKLGPELAYQFIEPMVGGIQAGRIDELSAKSVFPSLLEAARLGGSLMKNLRKLG